MWWGWGSFKTDFGGGSGDKAAEFETPEMKRNRVLRRHELLQEVIHLSAYKDTNTHTTSHSITRCFWRRASCGEARQWRGMEQQWSARSSIHCREQRRPLAPVWCSSRPPSPGLLSSPAAAPLAAAPDK
jgi:hypothetical protein